MKDKGAVWVIGVVCDGVGVGAAAIRATGTHLHALGPGAWRTWTGAESEALAGPAGAAHEVLETAAATMVAALTLDDAPTLLVVEMPDPGATPAILAEVTGLPVVHDLRAADLRLGGSGHPLEPVFHHALARFQGQSRLTLLDLGARAALSQARPDRGGPEAEGVLCAFETGPGVGLLPAHDRKGKVHSELLERMLQAPYLARMPPKVLGPTDFVGLGGVLAALPPADAAATLRALVAQTVALGVAMLPVPPGRIIVTGPGRNDLGLMAWLERALPCAVIRAEEAGLHGDLLAAQALAFVGLRAALGLPTTFPSTTGGAAAVGGAQITSPGALAQAVGISKSAAASSNPSN